MKQHENDLTLTKTSIRSIVALWRLYKVMRSSVVQTCQVPRILWESNTFWSHKVSPSHLRKMPLNLPYKLIFHLSTLLHVHSIPESFQKRKIYQNDITIKTTCLMQTCDYSQTCIRWPLLGPLKSGRLGQVVVL